MDSEHARIPAKLFFLSALLFSCSCVFAQAAAHPLVKAAKTQIGVTTSYDPSYVTLAYPGGDVPENTGVCTDVVIRAFRATGTDLQKAVHEDMQKHFSSYPQNWGLSKPDHNIDHRRVPNLMTFFTRQGWQVKDDTYQAGDVIAWDLGSGITHIGIVSVRKSRDGTPLIIHNIGAGTQEENILFQFEIIGHYRGTF